MGNDPSSYRVDVFDQILECVVGIHSNHSEKYVPAVIGMCTHHTFQSLGIIRCRLSYTEANVDAADAIAVYETFIRSWYHYSEDRTVDREKEIIDMIFKLCDLSLKLRAVTLARKVCKPWAEMLKTNLDAVQSSIKLMDADVVMCYAVTMLRRYSLRPEWVLYNDYHPPSKHIPVRVKHRLCSLFECCVPSARRDNQPLLLIWKDDTPSWMLGLVALKKMGEDAQVRAPYKRLPTVFEITVDRNIPDHPYVAASTARRCALGLLGVLGVLGVLKCWGCYRMDYDLSE